MTPAKRLQIQTELALLPLPDLAAMTARQEWLSSARPLQLPPEDFFAWVPLMGRGGGKTRAGAEWAWWNGYKTPERTAVVGPTLSSVRSTCFEGESGLLAVVPEALRVSYNRTSVEMIIRTACGKETIFQGFSSESPERLRGPQHHRAWCDELAAWRYSEETWDMLMMGMRLGLNPQMMVTTTPRPTGVLRSILIEDDTVHTVEDTFANEANLPKKFLEKLRKKYLGTRLGEQELSAKILSDNPYALWSTSQIEGCRIRECPDQLDQIVVAIDPPVTSGEDADECGMIVAGKVRGETPEDDIYYVLEDLSSQGKKPSEWAQDAVNAYHRWGADHIIAEVNNGGELVEAVIRHCDSRVAYEKVHATRGKVTRADPISTLYEQKRVHHVGTFPKLEDQMCDFTTDFDKKTMGYSPDRVDALVWSLWAVSGETSRYSLRNV